MAYENENSTFPTRAESHGAFSFGISARLQSLLQNVARALVTSRQAPRRMSSCSPQPTILCGLSGLWRFVGVARPLPPSPCTARISVPRRLHLWPAAGSGALPPEAPCLPPRRATGAPATRHPTATARGPTTVPPTSSKAASGPEARRHRRRAGLTVPAPDTRVRTAVAGPPAELSTSRGPTSSPTRAATRDTARYGAGWKSARKGEGNSGPRPVGSQVKPVEGRRGATAI